MILIPIGHEQDGTRRIPWVTFGLMTACALAFVLTGFGGTRQQSEAEQAFEAAVQFWLEHPRLKLDPEVERRVHGLKTSEFREAFREGLRANAPKEENLEQLQAELDRLCAAALQTLPSHPFNRWGLVPARLSPLSLLSYMFLHAGWLHLLFNMLFLYLSGPFIEDVWGRPLFAGFYVLSGIVAALAFVVPNASAQEPLVGASGAIAGVMGAFLVRYWNTRIHFFYAASLVLRGRFAAPAWLMLGLWFVQQVFLALLTSRSSGEAAGGVAYAAHIGGFAFGVGIAFAMRSLRMEERYLAAAIAARTQTVLVKNDAVEEAMRAAGEGRRDEAWARLVEAAEQTPGDADTALALWNLALEIDRIREAAPAMTRLVQDELKRGDTDLALEHWTELRNRVPTATLDPLSLVRFASVLAPRGHRKEACECLRRALLPTGRAPSAALVLKIAALAADLDGTIARAALDIALRRPDLDPTSRSEADRIAARLHTAESGGVPLARS